MSSDENDRLLRLERKVDFLFQRLGVDPDAALLTDGFQDPYGTALPASFHEALRRGQLIQAIKIYREVTGFGLRESKEAVEAMARGHR